MELPVYKLVINPDDETGVDFVSLVTSPAIERDFVYFQKDKPRLNVAFKIQSDEKRIIFGMAMEADKKIYRYDEARGEYYVYFDKQTIFEIAKKWAKGDPAKNSAIKRLAFYFFLSFFNIFFFFNYIQ